jgi:hypothetical protein
MILALIEPKKPPFFLIKAVVPMVNDRNHSTHHSTVKFDDKRFALGVLVERVRLESA